MSFSLESPMSCLALASIFARLRRLHEALIEMLSSIFIICIAMQAVNTRL